MSENYEPIGYFEPDYRDHYMDCPAYESDSPCKCRELDDQARIDAEERKLAEHLENAAIKRWEERNNK